jgi:hypothetical protein
MVGVVKFEGQSPFLLPEAKSAQADVFEKSLVVTLYSQIEGQGPELVSIAVQMLPDVALASATQLIWISPAPTRRRLGRGQQLRCRGELLRLTLAKPGQK